MTVQPPAWRVSGVSFRYPGSDHAAIDDVTVDVRRSACTAILGPNGSGKSTLLRLALGLLRPSAGQILLSGRPLERWSRRELARTVGVVPQDEEISFPLTVRELVAMGRYPHLGAFQAERAADRAAIDAAMRKCDVDALAGRLVQTLSGGERQRVRLARALAQEPAMLVLDEPTRALDIRHEMEILELVRRLVEDEVTVLLVTHHLNLAARYADELLLLDLGRVAAYGAPEEVLRRELLERVYQWPLRTTSHPGPGPDQGAVQVTPLSAGASSNLRPARDASPPP